MSATTARLYWKALIDNATRLIADAQTLLDGSPGRARALTVLAQEELGKALWLYGDFQSAWNAGEDEERTVHALNRHGRSHTRKYFEALLFGEYLPIFWGDDGNAPMPAEGESWEEFATRRLAEAETAAENANLAKQHGFYVDIDSEGLISSPSDANRRVVGDDLMRAAQVVEMLLIQDHTRMKHEAAAPYDSTHEQQFRLLSISHPAEYHEWLAKGGDPLGTNASS